MLTADLVRARVVKGEIRPRYLEAGDAAVLALAEELVATFRAHVGMRREDLQGALSAVLGEGTDFLLHRGLAKLLTDRAEFDVKSPCEPSVLREKLFTESAKHFPPVAMADAVHAVTRDDVIARVAAELQIDPAVVTASMYADLEDEQVMTAAPDLEAPALVTRYNVALAQAVLLRATSLTLEIAPGDPQRYQQLFRWIKFYRLMHAVSGTGATGYVIRLDGPLSLFQLSQKYGLQLAEFIPALMLCKDWRAEAEVLWGIEKRGCVFRMTSEQKWVSHYPDRGVYLTREEEWLVERFEALGSRWALERKSEIHDLGGRGVLIPDFVLRHRDDGRVAYLDIVGFWRREYLEARLEMLRDAGPPNLVLAVPARLKGSDEDWKAQPGEVMFYKDVILAKELLERVERVAVVDGRGPAPEPPKPKGRKRKA